jgi:uncharacterized protein YdeI (YjbR/CyaY-like superfamily)
MTEPSYKDGISLFYAPDAPAWRAWLEANHLTAKAVWLVYYKKESGLSRVSYDDAVDEAICFGWIDSVINKLDEVRSIQYFSPRNPKSNWSKVNKARVERLEKAGKITTAGQQMIDLAKRTGTWNALDGVENMDIPADLQAAFDLNLMASQNFEAFARTYKRGILEWLFNAKRPDTRQQRIEKIVSMAARNLRAVFDK